MIKRILKYGQLKWSFLDEHTIEVIKKSSASSIVKAMGMLIGVFVSIFLGRTLGADGLGVINLSLRVINILIVVGLLGFEQIIVKEVAVAFDNGNYESVKNTTFTSYIFNGITAITITAILIILSPWLSNHVFKEVRLTFPLIIAALGLAPATFSRIFSSALIGYKKVWQSNLVDNTLSTATTGFLILLYWLLYENLTIKVVAICYLVGRLTVTISIGLYWKYLNKNHKFTNPTLIFKKLFSSAQHLFVASIAGILVTNSDVILLGAFSDAKDIGSYTVASRIAMLTSFFLNITNSSISPKIAALYQNGRITEMELMVQRVTKALGIIGMLALILFIFAGKFILSIWGPEFTSSYYILIILGVGQLVNIGTGAVGQILIMCGYERTFKNIRLIFLILDIIFKIVLIYLWGALGAAIALSLNVICSNIVRLIFVKKKVGISTLNIKLFN